jgi:hypothetical protein
MSTFTMPRLAAWLGLAGLLTSTPDLWGQEEALVAVPSLLGDSGRDLVFTPVPRCRVIDTRVAGGRLTAGSPRYFDVAGTLAGQGGASDCLVPFGPATAVVINFMAVQPLGAGTLSAWPFGGTMPTATVMNFNARVRGGGNGANEVVLPICNPAVSSCTYDLIIQANANETHLVADVAGYFSGVTGLTVPWSSVTDKPAGFADGTDNDTLYSAAGTGGLSLSGTQFSIVPGGVTSARIADGAIVDADVAPTAAIAATKVAGTAAVLNFTATQAFDTSTLVIDPVSNKVGIGTITPLSPLTVATSTEPYAASAQIGHGTARGLVVKRTANDSGYTDLTLLKSRGDAVTPAQPGDGVGRFAFDVVDGTSTIRRAGEVLVDVVAMSPTNLATNMTFQVHNGAPSAPPEERLRISSAGIAVTGGVSATGGLFAAGVSATGSITAGVTVLAAEDMSAGDDVIAGGDVVAGGGVFVGRLGSQGSATSVGQLTGATWDTGCTASNRGEIRVIESSPSLDWLCACLSLAAGDLQWTCFRP